MRWPRVVRLLVVCGAIVIMLPSSWWVFKRVTYDWVQPAAWVVFTAFLGECAPRAWTVYRDGYLLEARYCPTCTVRTYVAKYCTYCWPNCP